MRYTDMDTGGATRGEYLDLADQQKAREKKDQEFQKFLSDLNSYNASSEIRRQMVAACIAILQPDRESAWKAFKANNAVFCHGVDGTDTLSQFESCVRSNIEYCEKSTAHVGGALGWKSGTYGYVCKTLDYLGSSMERVRSFSTTPAPKENDSASLMAASWH